MKLNEWEKRDDSKSHKKEGEGEWKKKKRRYDDRRPTDASIEQESLRIGAGGGERERRGRPEARTLLEGNSTSDSPSRLINFN